MATTEVRPRQVQDNLGEYHWPMGAKTVLVKREYKPLGDLKYDPLNQRIQYALRAAGESPMAVTQERIEEVLHQKMDTYLKDLYHQINEVGGLINPLVVTHDGTVIEGNCRLFALRILCKDWPGTLQFCEPICEVLSEDFDEEARLLFLGDCHVSQKQSWNAYEISEHVWKMLKSKSHEYVARSLRMSKSSVKKSNAAYQMMTEYLNLNPDPQNLDKFSYCLEFQKKKKLVEGEENDPAFRSRFFTWMKDKKLTRGEQVRKLPDFLQYDAVLEVLDTAGYAAAETKYNNLVATDPENPNMFAALGQVVQELEGLTLKEMATLKDPHSEAVKDFKAVYARLRMVAEMADINLDETE